MDEIKFRAWDIKENRMWGWEELKHEISILIEEGWL